MSDLLSISGNAVMAYQQALGTVSNNIANVSTDGYSRQAVVLQAGTPTHLGPVYIGTGVVFDQVQRQYSAFADANLRNSNSDLQSQAPMVTYANRVIDVMSSATTGLVSSLDQFFASARSLSTDPASTVLRGAFMRDAQGLTSSFGQLSSQLDLVDTETSQAVQTDVSQLNTYAQQLAQVNKQLGKTPSLAKQPAELLDQRDLLLRQMSDFSHLNTSFKPNGEVTVSLGASLTQDVIVDGGVATQVGVDLNAAASGKISLVLDPYGKPSALSGVTSGQLAGLMAFREQVLSSTRNALDYLANTVVKAVNDIHSQGVDGYGQKAGNLFAIDPKASSVAGGLSVAITDPMRIAAAAQFRVIKDANNTSTADATVSYTPSTPTGPGVLTDILTNNANPSAGRPVVLTASRSVAAVTAIPAGMQDVTIYLDGAQPGQQLQLMTREGTQLLGPAFDAAAQSQVMTSGQGMAAGATYSTAYLNATGDKSYQGMTVFYGARAAVLSQQTYDSQGQPGPPLAIPALLSGTRIPAGQTLVAPATALIAAGALSLNGIPLAALTPAPGKTLQASDIAAWLTLAKAPGVTATATNEVIASTSGLKLDRTLTINGQIITRPAGGFGTAAALVQAVNDQTTTTGVVASFSRDGQVLLTNVSTQQGNDINVGPGGTTGNALNITDGTYTGQVQVQRAVVSGQDTPVEISFGPAGGPSDLAHLGFRTSATIKGAAPEDVLVFVSGEGKASVSASYSGTPTNTATALRSQPMKVTFTADNTYTITDTTSGTVLAQRSFDPSQLTTGIDYRGLKLNFTTAPKAGDSFALDGNTDGTGNNENMLRLTGLESAQLVGSKTISAAYISQVNDMGNISKQATIAQKALTVVHDQAVTARDQVSGVSLDEEAANLIRYQQAYQASAKVMQIAGTLFDAVLAVPH